MALIGTEGAGVWPAVSQAKGPGVKQYKTTVNGVETELLLSDEDAKELGLVETKERTPANKERTPASKAPAAPAKKAPAKNAGAKTRRGQRESLARQESQIMPELTTTDVAQYTDGRLDPEDPETERMLNAALAAARRYCGWHVCPTLTDDTITIDGPGSPLLVLPTLNLQKLTSIAEQGIDVDLTYVQISSRGLARKLAGFPAQPLDSDWWRWAEVIHPSAPYMRIDIELYWTGGYSSLEIVMTHGFEDAPDWQAAVLSYLSRSSQDSSGSREIVGPFQFPPAVLASGSMFTAQEKNVLDLYRLELVV